MKGTAKEIQISGRTIRLDDWLQVEHTNGRRIKGKVIELWGSPELDYPQARLSCGWCFHDADEILEHRPKEE